MERDEQHIEFNDLIVRYLAGEMSAVEKEQFELIIKTDTEKMKQFTANKKIWEGVDQLAARGKYDMKEEWNLLAGKIDLSDDIIHQSNTKVDKPKTVSRSLRTTFLRIAAALVIGMLGLAGWYGSRQMLMYDSVAVETGTQLIELPDGSFVTLNSGSSLSFTTKESLSYRKVKLKGEAFFEVARDSTRPFMIDAGPAQIEVLGTSFNVNAYPDNADVEVTVSSGLVAMSSKQDKDNLILLNRGNTGLYSKKNSALNLILAGNVNAVAWKTGILEFNETRLEDVVEALNHTYKSNIIIEHDELLDLTITVSFNNQEVDAVLNVLASTLDLKIEKTPTRIIIGTED